MTGPPEAVLRSWPVSSLCRCAADYNLCQSQPRRVYILGLAQNPRLVAAIAGELEQAWQQFEATEQPARIFAELCYQTLETWSRERRVVAKAEHLAQGVNPRFVVTSLSAEDRPARPLYEEDYCARGEAENRIKEQQLHQFADRTSAGTM